MSNTVIAPPSWPITGVGHVRAGLALLRRSAIPAIAILRNIRSATAPTGKLLLLELVLPEGTPWHPGMPIDLEMLVTVGGRERTASEYVELLSQKDFRPTTVVSTAGPMSIVEARPA